MIGRRELFGAAVATAALARTLQRDIAKAASPAQAAGGRAEHPMTSINWHGARVDVDGL